MTVLESDRTEWEAAAVEQWQAAEEATKGYLLNDDALTRGISEWSLWHGPLDQAMNNASEELLEFWAVHPRITKSDFDKSKRADRKEERQAPKPQPLGVSLYRSYASVKRDKWAYLWEGYLPFGTVTLVGGMTMIAKSILLADWTARATTGNLWPDGTAGVPAGNVLVIAREDHPGKDTAPRLDAAGADTGKVFYFVPPDGTTFTVQDHIDDLRQCIEDINREHGPVIMVTMDPLMACTSKNLGGNVTVRKEITEPLIEVAEEYNLAFPIICHLTKAGKLGGSQGLEDAARQVIMIENDPETQIRTMTVRGNIGAQVAPIRYTLDKYDDDDRDEIPRIGYLFDDDAETPARGPQGVLRELQKFQGVAHIPELAERCNMPENTVRVYLNTLKKHKLAINPRRGEWVAYKALSAA